MQHDGQVTCCVQIAEGDRRNWRLTETAGSETHGDTVILTLYIEQVVLSLKHARRSMGQVRGNYAMVREDRRRRPGRYACMRGDAAYIGEKVN